MVQLFGCHGVGKDVRKLGMSLKENASEDHRLAYPPCLESAP